MTTGATAWDFLIAMKIPIWTCSILLIMVFCILNANNLLSLSGAFAGLFMRFSKTATKKQISASIRSSVIKASKTLNAGSLDILPTDLKIKWAENDDMNSFFDDNCVVVRLKREENPNVNYVNIIHHFVSRGLLANQRRYFNNEIMSAAELLLTQRIVALAKPTAMDYFFDNIYNPAVEGDMDLQENYTQLKQIELNGMLFHVYLNELSKSASTILGEIPDPCLRAESCEFLRFLHPISIRTTNEENVLNFKSNYFNVAILLAPKKEIEEDAAISGHLLRINKLLDEKYNTIYLFGIGHRAQTVCKIASLAKEKEDRLVKSITHKYRHTFSDTGTRINAICIELDTY